MYGQYCSSERDGAGIVLTVKAVNDGYLLTWRDKSILTSDPIGQIHNILFAEKKIQPDIFALHAGGVCNNGKAYIFAASTTTGKTTLIAYLTQMGFEYISDDCLFIDMNDLSVYPCHLPVHLRSGGVDVLNRYNVIPDNITYVNERYVYTPAKLSPLKMELEKIFFISRTTSECETRGFTKTKALKQLMLSPIVTYPISKRYIEFLNLLSSYCFTMKYNNMEYVLNQINNT